MHDQVDAVWEACRWANQYVAILAAIAVSYRLVLMVLDRERWRSASGRHLLAWFAYIALGLIVSGFAAEHYNGGPTDANWTSGARTSLHVVAICLSLWWPHPRRFVPYAAR
jgi:uncharacterized membrane protein YidH (DUF202 family)